MASKALGKPMGMVKSASNEELASLGGLYPADEGFNRISLPRITFVSQDKTEETGSGRNKKIEIVTPAGTFFRESQKKDKDGNLELDADTGRPIWDKEELGDEIEIEPVFQRKQLKFFDSANGNYVSSNVYDENDEIVALYQGKEKVKVGKPAALKKDYEAKDVRTGKVKTLLEDQAVLYVLYKGELHQMNIRGSSLYALRDFKAKTRPTIAAYIVLISSEQMEKGSNVWNCMRFNALRPLSSEEVVDAKGIIAELQSSISEQKARTQAALEADADFQQA